ncbi:hypothetical protein V5O48_004183 [Marasmius crinis-equi]|uniref:Fe2OG dioxygenase domain-containing protein n=1 Tax=Marasmius crinis-equi TaxID=585013 RepID=A0ABR3FQT4_9AGAR
MKHNRSDSTAGSEDPDKKTKARNTDSKTPFDHVLRTAYDLHRALLQVSESDYPKLGKVVTIWPDEDFPPPPQAKREILKQLRDANVESNKVTRSVALDQYEERFSLKVTHPGCEYENESLGYSGVDISVFEKWLRNAPVSGFGDNKALETKVDSEIRKACEIPASGFEVQPKLLQDIAKLWSENFVPSKVRVEPYKIHLYGKGGHFKSHRDTPEASLVGTFLLGIGDSTQDAYPSWTVREESLRATEVGNFCIGGIRRTANAGQWVAFHPDVPHSVEPLESGCRGVIAFKIFSLEPETGTIEASQRYPTAVANTTAVLNQIEGSFGIVLEHEYPMGTDPSNLVASDAVLLSAAKQMKGVKVVEVIPIAVDVHETKDYNQPSNQHREAGSDSESDFDSEGHRVSAAVYPFTRYHVDMCLRRSIDEETKASASWMKGLKGLPFYSWDFKENALKWSSSEVEDINWTGNEADGSRETSLYLAYAIVILSESHRQEEEQEESNAGESD